MFLQCVCLCGTKSLSQCELSRVSFFLPLIWFWLVCPKIVSPTQKVNLIKELCVHCHFEMPRFIAQNSQTVTKTEPRFCFVISTSSPQKKIMSAGLSVGASTREEGERKECLLKMCFAASNYSRFTSLCVSLHRTVCLVRRSVTAATG